MIKTAIVEDLTEFRELWREILNYTEGYCCIATFDNADDAVAQLPFLAPDIVLMDIQLPPKGNGIECVRRLRSQCPTTQFLIFTAFPDDDYIFEALKAGATGYILKKTSPTKVLEAITELYEGGSPMSPAIARRVMESFHNKATASETWGLVAHEWQILGCLSRGMQYKGIADVMTISLAMVKQHIHTMYHKLEVSNRTDAVNKYLGR